MVKKMYPKQCGLTQRQNLLLKRLAKERSVSESEVVRQALMRFLEMEDTDFPVSGDSSPRSPGIDKGVVVIVPDFDSPL